MSFSFKTEVLRRLEVLMAQGEETSKLLKELLVTIDDLKAKVETETTVEKSAVVLLASLAAQLRAIATDPAKIQALADQLDANNKELSDAVIANTPAA